MPIKQSLFKRVLILAGILFTGSSGYAKSDEKPVPVSPTLTSEVVVTECGETKTLFKDVQRILIGEGFLIQRKYSLKGFFSTVSQKVTLSPKEADCGTNGENDYLTLKGTVTHASYDLNIRWNQITIRANITGEYSDPNKRQGTTLKCVSKGVLEACLNKTLSRHMGIRKVSQELFPAGSSFCD